MPSIATEFHSFVDLFLAQQHSTHLLPLHLHSGLESLRVSISRKSRNKKERRRRKKGEGRRKKGEGRREKGEGRREKGETEEEREEKENRKVCGDLFDEDLNEEGSRSILTRMNGKAMKEIKGKNDRMGIGEIRSIGTILKVFDNGRGFDDASKKVDVVIVKEHLFFEKDDVLCPDLIIERLWHHHIKRFLLLLRPDKALQSRRRGRRRRGGRW